MNRSQLAPLTLLTADMSEMSKELPPPRTRLSLLLDEKIAAKIRNTLLQEIGDPIQ